MFCNLNEEIKMRDSSAEQQRKEQSDSASLFKRAARAMSKKVTQAKLPPHAQVKEVREIIFEYARDFLPFLESSISLKPQLVTSQSLYKYRVVI